MDSAGATRTRLSEGEIAAYHRDGLVVPDYRIPEAMLGRMREALDRLLTDNPDMASDIMICPHDPHGSATKFTGSEAWLDFARQPEILDMVEQLIGPDIILWGTTLFGKPAGSGKETPWHQDGEYWPIRPLATCTAWIAIDESTPENGCLRYIEGSHRDRRVFSHHQDDRPDWTLNQELDADQLDESRARDVVLTPGQVSLHDIYLVHGSNTNRSARRRAGYVLRLMPATSHFDRALGAGISKRSKVVDFENRALHLLRGVDRCGKNNFATGH